MQEGVREGDKRRGKRNVKIRKKDKRMKNGKKETRSELMKVT